MAQGYQIVKTAQELRTVLTAAGTLNNTNKKVILMADIDLNDLGDIDGNGSNWNAIGNNVNPFRGIFDGNGFTISNLKMDKSAAHVGFFGFLDSATIQNFTLENVNIKNTDYAGGVTGWMRNNSTISNCSVSGSVTSTGVGNFSVGGIVGVVYDSSIINSSSSASVTGQDHAGGLAGYFDNVTAMNCWASGNVIGGGGGASRAVGGFVGFIRSLGSTVIDNCYSTGNVTATTNPSAGCFIGTAGSNSTITNCYSTGKNFSTTTSAKGGFIGSITTGSVIKNYAFATQTTAGVNTVSGIGAMTPLGPESVLQTSGKDPSWFANKSNQQSILGTSGAWDFTGATPKLAWQAAQGKNLLTFQIGTDGTQLSAVTVDTGFSLGGFSVSFANPDSARAALISCDALLKQINVKRGEIGASSNIIGSIIDGNTVTNENIVASRSRVQDADIARESANAVRNQILQNASAALLAQNKNMSGDVVLMLLRGI